MQIKVRCPLCGMLQVVDSQIITTCPTCTTIMEKVKPVSRKSDNVE